METYWNRFCTASAQQFQGALELINRHLAYILIKGEREASLKDQIGIVGSRLEAAGGVVEPNSLQRKRKGESKR